MYRKFKKLVTAERTKKVNSKMHFHRQTVPRGNARSLGVGGGGKAGYEVGYLPHPVKYTVVRVTTAKIIDIKLCNKCY